MRRLSHVAFSLLLLVAGCLGEITEPDTIQANDCICVQFDIGHDSAMKSSVSPDEDWVDDLNLYAYCDGMLAASGYFKGGEQPQLKLLVGHSYNLYSLANVGPVVAEPSEDEFRENCLFQFTCVGDLGEHLPMAWSKEGVVVSYPAPRVNVMLERLVAKVLFSVDKTALSGLCINSIRVRQSPLLVWPFKFQTGSHPDSSDQIADGDYATSEDLSLLNEGGQISFYVLENCQGRLLDGNVDPWAKVPENIPDKAGLCTYLEISCSFKPGYFYSGNVVYRLYLGRDNVSDFNIRRNNVLIARLFLTNEALGEVSWRVDADVSVNDGYAQGWLSRGLHSADDLYVGEKFEYTLLLADEVLEHVRRNPENLRLCMGNSGDEASESMVQFGELESCGSETSSGLGAGGSAWRFKVRGLCRRPGSGTLQLRDDAGKVIAEFDEVIVRKPRLFLSEYDSASSIVSGLGDTPQYSINGETQGLYVYLVDSRRHNLNTSSGCGFELSLFDIECTCEGLTEKSDGAISLDICGGVEGDNGPVSRCSVVVRNDGRSDDISKDLLRFISSGDFAYLVFSERNHSLKVSAGFQLDYLPISLTLVDNGWAGYADCQLSMLVDNPSNLPIEVQCWQLNFSNDNYDAIIRNEIVYLYGKKFSRDKFNYICGSPASGLKPIYCSGSRFTTSGSGAHAMPEIKTSSIYHALQYDYMGQASLSHHIDAMFSDGTPIYDLKANDNLEDGSMEYSVVYGTDGWNNKGIWLYTAGALLSRPSSDFDGLRGVKPCSLTELYQGNTGVISVSYNAGSKNFIASVNSSDDVGIQIDVDITVEAEGYVQTRPNGTWGKKVDNYCSTTVSTQVKALSLSTTFANIDANAFNEAIDAIYAHTYPDSYNAIGSSNSYSHCAHPTSLKVSLKLSLAGSCSEKMRRIAVSMPSSISFYHPQEDVSYSVPVSTEIKNNTIGFVENIL